MDNQREVKTFYYLVRIAIIIDGYEKNVRALVSAENKTDAGTIAINGECHNVPIWTDTNKQRCIDGDFEYSVENASEIPEGDFRLLQSLFSKNDY